MLILIDNKSGAPIYDQIFTQIKGHILSGELKPDEALPSIRALAKDLRISVITTKRAYEELERSGFVYTIPGKGSFVCAKNTELMREEHLKQIEEHMTAVRSLAQLTGLSREEVQEMWSLMWEESE
ncbi:MAG: GntR family transcriptional regulator [Oscillospiraceae bacterium]|nr:GntR family transcriptional regulator [Oscillospiraceae bacterium]